MELVLVVTKDLLKQEPVAYTIQIEVHGVLTTTLSTSMMAHRRLCTGAEFGEAIKLNENVMLNIDDNIVDSEDDMYGRPKTDTIYSHNTGSDSICCRYRVKY